MIAVEVRDEDGVHVGRGAGVSGWRRRWAIRGRRTGSVRQARRSDLDQHGGVTHIGDPAGGDGRAIVLAARRTPHHPGRVIAGHPTGTKNRHMRGRRVAVTALLVLATLLTTAFGFGLWAKRQALDTNNWVDTSKALLEDEEIRQAVGLFIIDRLYQSDEVAGPDRAGAPAAARPAREARRRRAEAGRAAECGAGARHGRRAQGLGDGQPDSAQDAAPRDRERRRRGRACRSS